MSEFRLNPVQEKLSQRFNSSSAPLSIVTDKYLQGLTTWTCYEALKFLHDGDPNGPARAVVYLIPEDFHLANTVNLFYKHFRAETGPGFHFSPQQKRLIFDLSGRFITFVLGRSAREQLRGYDKRSTLFIADYFSVNDQLLDALYPLAPAKFICIRYAPHLPGVQHVFL